MSRGFTIIELLIVTTIITTFSVVLILNFRSSPRGKTARVQTASVVIADFRKIQSSALAGSVFQGSSVCGYGIHYVDPVTYIIYAGVLGGGITKCSDSNHNYQAGTDLLVETRKISNDNMEIATSFVDVFFESPDPKTYLDNSLITNLPATITIWNKGQLSCVSDSCTYVKVYLSGRIDLE